MDNKYINQIKELIDQYESGLLTENELFSKLTEPVLKGYEESKEAKNG